jgi:hypothetical protein
MKWGFFRYAVRLELLKIRLRVNSLVCSENALWKRTGRGGIDPLMIDFRTTSRRVVSLLGKRPHGTNFVNVGPNTSQQFCLFWIVLKRGKYLTEGNEPQVFCNKVFRNGFESRGVETYCYGIRMGWACS